MYLMVLEGCIYTIVADIYAFRLAFSGTLNCVLHHFASRLAAKRIAFCTKTHSILHQNAVQLVANSPKVGAKDGLLK